LVDRTFTDADLTVGFFARALAASFGAASESDDGLSWFSWVATSASAESNDVSFRKRLVIEVPVMEDGTRIWFFLDNLFFLSWNLELLSERFPRLWFCSLALSSGVVQKRHIRLLVTGPMISSTWTLSCTGEPCVLAVVVVIVWFVDVTVLTVSGFTGDRDNFDRPKVVRRTEARFTPSSFDCLLFMSLLLLVMVGMWLTGSVRVGGVDDEFVPVAVVLTTT
jgi:hypothetical protein